MLNIIVLGVGMLNVVMLSVVILIVVASLQSLTHKKHLFKQSIDKKLDSYSQNFLRQSYD